MTDGIRSYLKHLGMLSGSVWAYFVAVFLMGVGQAIFRVLRNQYVVDLGMGEQGYTRIQGFNSIGGLVIALVAVGIIGRFKARPLLVGIAVLNFAGFAAQAMWGSVEVFFGAAFAAGIAMSLNAAMGAPFLMRNTGAKERIFAFSFQAVVGWPLAGVVGSWLAGVLQSSAEAFAQGGAEFWGAASEPRLFGYRVALMAAAICMAAALVPIAMIRRDEHSTDGQSFRQLMRFHDKKRLFLISFPEAIVGFGAGLTIPFFNVYFKEVWSLEPKQVALVFTAMMAVGVFSFLLAPALVKRFGQLKVIIGAQILSLPFFVELALGHVLWMAIVAFILRNNLMNLAQPVLKQFAQEVSDPRDRNAVAVTVHTSRHAAWTLANFVAGYLIAAASGGFEIVIYTTIGCYVVAIIAEAIVFPRLARDKPAASQAGQ